MSSEFGSLLKISVFGQSHGRAIGVVVDGLPAGEAIDLEELNAFLARRKPGKSPLSTARREADAPVFLSGLENGVTCGAPLCAVIENGDQHSSDYDALRDKPRPGHADYTAFVKWGGQADMRGGGHFSGRLTLGLVAAGVVAKKILGGKIRIESRILEIDNCNNPDDFPKVIEAALRSQDSVGGIVECTATGVPHSLGEPFFDSAESVISHLFFSIPAVKGVEFGAGFEAARMRGSEHNDPIISPDGTTATNNAGGITGGITNGNPVVARVVVKPTSSISSPQITLNTETGKPEELKIKGRHDACIALRAPVVVEAAMAIALCDLTLIAKSQRP
ncbi:MAG: chorismate synthase [Oscillibacter sp.]|nr:chorismate synthase [Oscillibacter sp.]